MFQTFIGSLLNCPQQQGLGHATVRRPELHPDGWQGSKHLSHCTNRKLCWKQDSQDSNQALQYGMWVSQGATQSLGHSVQMRNWAHLDDSLA